MRTSLHGDSLPELLKASWVNLWSTLPEVALAAPVWLLVSLLQAWQTAKFHGIQGAAS